ncbi:hypothetical protein IKZ80_07820, partial [bacterium]|nr:hypothetical protein [bacterium]
HIIDVKSTDGIAAFIGFLKHFFRCYQWHNLTLPLKIIKICIKSIFTNLPFYYILISGENQVANKNFRKK